jgi:hypothetical protein
MCESKAGRGTQVRWWQSTVELKGIFLQQLREVIRVAGKTRVGPSVKGECGEYGGDVTVKVRKSLFDKQVGVTTKRMALARHPGQIAP